MAESLHPAAIHHLRPFITAPGDTDVLFIAMAILVLLGVIGIGVFYFKLHALPEHMAHRGQKVLLEIVAVLALIALFTHNPAEEAPAAEAPAEEPSAEEAPAAEAKAEPEMEANEEVPAEEPDTIDTTDTPEEE